ncbi:hypothetical protein [Streptomyces sp. ICBB 8177]|uniref:hypothetical protein n=1 Tax=Streptomyces sp. ICBB 8177 TaxID=563922 RepID=UPI0011B37A9E|nr:hypothetical protein [Streptomyces sp. ICBB 8177]
MSARTAFLDHGERVTGPRREPRPTASPRDRLERVASWRDRGVPDRVATVLVRQQGPAINAVEPSGGRALDGPGAAPNGARMIARLPAGPVLEYIEFTDA